ncbi:MAG: response regulator [Gammaproteobacteria bacterium]|nr:response regulator [Gammaproteobacteria bacterium]
MAIKKVLVVDDSSTDLHKLEGIVSKAGYTTFSASNGTDAIEMAKVKKPDAILLDIIMNDMNGFQVCRALTTGEETKGIPVVLVSSKKEKTDRVWAEEQGASGYITKPYTEEQILEQLSSLN